MSLQALDSDFWHKWDDSGDSAGVLEDAGFLPCALKAIGSSLTSVSVDPSARSRGEVAPSSGGLQIVLQRLEK